MIPIEKCYQLSENVLVLIHMQTILAAKIQKSSPLTQKISVTNYISIISKNDQRFLVDSNVIHSLINHRIIASIFSAIMIASVRTLSANHPISASCPPILPANRLEHK